MLARCETSAEEKPRSPSCVITGTAQKGLYQVAMCLHDMYHRGGARKWYPGFLQRRVLNMHQLNISCLLAIIGSQFSQDTKMGCKEDTTKPQFTQLPIDLIGPPHRLIPRLPAFLSVTGFSSASHSMLSQYYVQYFPKFDTGSRTA